jgi:hypothetical protein
LKREKPAKFSLAFSFRQIKRTYAARVAFLEGISGAGAQIYAEKTGVGSRVSPCEMMIPSGSF